MPARSHARKAEPAIRTAGCNSAVKRKHYSRNKCLRRIAHDAGERRARATGRSSARVVSDKSDSVGLRQGTREPKAQKDGSEKKFCHAKGRAGLGDGVCRPQRKTQAPSTIHTLTDTVEDAGMFPNGEPDLPTGRIGLSRSDFVWASWGRRLGVHARRRRRAWAGAVVRGGSGLKHLCQIRQPTTGAHPRCC